MCSWAACTCNSVTPHVNPALVAHAEARCPDDGHGDHRHDPSNNDGEAIIAGGVPARVPGALWPSSGQRGS
eukprot:14929007-Alexandrium_andersonii.AAC.1